MKRRFLTLVLALLLLLSPSGFAAAEGGESGPIVLLFTSDVHCHVDENLGYSALAAYRKEQEALYGKENVLLLDCGDAIMGNTIGTLSNGAYITEIMDHLGYDMAIPGNHEFDYGMSTFFDLAEHADFPYICCNFIDLRTGKSVLPPYQVLDCGSAKVGFVGVLTPETYTSSTPANFQDENGNYIYGFLNTEDGAVLSAAVQKAVDGARAEGADYVVLMSHLGTEFSQPNWGAYDVIAQTQGIDVVLDGHSHSIIPGTYCPNKNGEEVLVVSAGTALTHFGRVTLSPDGFNSELISDYTERDPDTDALIDEIKTEYQALTEQVIASADFGMYIYDPVSGQRIVRRQETNLGDFCADAYRAITGAEIAIVNSGGIRADMAAGDITYGDVINVQPFGNMACMVEATGRQILDALENGVRVAELGDFGGFLQVSGISFEVHLYLPSTVVLDENSFFAEVTGEYRVKNVLVGGEPLDPDRIYTLASTNYTLLQGGDGFSMFRDCKLLLDEIMPDNQVLITYLKDHQNGRVGEGYADPYGQGRIRMISEAPEVPAPMNTYTVQSGDTLWGISLALYGSGGRWNELYRLNADILESPRMIYVGQTILVPAA